ncbi:hypothetical protein TRAPUB_2899 [Trametes pubescens]|uniref:Cation-transporting P-type ATPase N-terminal domain-containing protein n=1 Tax=Trametes pubescens TaxID=154538 RepID=A0A1M2VF96_TRAPU|nr:hypothetical protein TRAPUB_2899 [Trametes pubescens]
MDDAHGITEKPVHPAHDEEAAAATRAVAFPDRYVHDDGQEKAPHGMRPRGVEMKREMTKEEKELAEAGYQDLAEQKAGAKGGDAGLDAVDLHEHKLTLTALEAELDTAFDPKDPTQSPGLSADEAKARLARDGPNILTPPKKKSALRKVWKRSCSHGKHALTAAS